MYQRLKKMVPHSFKVESKKIISNIHATIANRISGGRFPETPVQHIVFVCKGNICRSAFSEHYLKSQRAVSHIKIESSGLDVERRTPSPKTAVEVAKEFGVDLRAHLAKSLYLCGLESADLIVPMEYSHLNRIVGMFPAYKHKTMLLRDFAPFPRNLMSNIDDPFEKNPNEFRCCFQLIILSLQGLIRRLESTDFNQS